MFQGRTFIFDKEMTKLLTTCYPLDEKDAAKGKGYRQHRGQILSPTVGGYSRLWHSYDEG
jgi:hypothetical protein